MDVVTYENNDEPVMVFADSKPNVTIDVDDASFEVANELIDGKSYMHIRKENGVTLTLVLTTEGAKKLTNAFVNVGRVRQGLPQIDYLTLLRKAIEDLGKGDLDE